MRLLNYAEIFFLKENIISEIKNYNVLWNKVIILSMLSRYTEHRIHKIE